MDRQKQIANALETYFSDANLLWDKVMQQHLDESRDGCVSFDQLAKLKKMKALEVTPSEIKEAALGHSMTKLKISKDSSAIGRIKPYVRNKTEELTDWSIYVEGLGKKHCTEHQIADLFSQIGHVSYVRFPPDRNGDCRCQGFCFVEFDTKQHVEKAVETMNQDNLRVMSKRQWLDLRDEYLAHQKKTSGHIKQLWQEYNNKHLEKEEEQQPKEDISYPKNVIVFVQNIHVKSAKTTVKALLEQSGASITFMKHKKGVDSCHARLASSEDTKKVVEYFKAHALIQASGTDIQGTATENASQAIKVRAISGNEEKIYWMTDQMGANK
ncbi:hypothetical protein [Absidia glauca]|uniref:RRM domain-containing protein n=1 Tax=Absidia glauca TaxID=4829 RepID=A0A163JIK6_ABSGL|nr:hypothetical protein [Absidia glauca]